MSLRVPSTPPLSLSHTHIELLPSESFYKEWHKMGFTFTQLKPASPRGETVPPPPYPPSSAAYPSEKDERSNLAAGETHLSPVPRDLLSHCHQGLGVPLPECWHCLCFPDESKAGGQGLESPAIPAFGGTCPSRDGRMTTSSLKTGRLEMFWGRCGLGLSPLSASRPKATRLPES